VIVISRAVPLPNASLHLRAPHVPAVQLLAQRSFRSALRRKRPRGCTGSVTSRPGPGHLSSFWSRRCASVDRWSAATWSSTSARRKATRRAPRRWPSPLSYDFSL